MGIIFTQQLTVMASHHRIDCWQKRQKRNSSGVVAGEQPLCLEQNWYELVSRGS